MNKLSVGVMVSVQDYYLIQEVMCKACITVTKHIRHYILKTTFNSDGF